MDLLVPELGKPATKIYRHKLVSALEMAIRASNAQYEPAEVLSYWSRATHFHTQYSELTGAETIGCPYARTIS